MVAVAGGILGGRRKLALLLARVKQLTLLKVNLMSGKLNECLTPAYTKNFYYFQSLIKCLANREKMELPK